MFKSHSITNYEVYRKAYQLYKEHNITTSPLLKFGTYAD